MTVGEKLIFPLKNEPKVHALYDSENKYITTIYNLEHKKEIVKRVNNWDKAIELLKRLNNNLPKGLSYFDINEFLKEIE